MNISWKLKQYTPFGENPSSFKSTKNLYASNLISNLVENNDLEIELVCNKKDFIKGELIDVLVKIKNNSYKEITIESPKHLLYQIDKDTMIIKKYEQISIKIPPFGSYYHLIDPLGYVSYNEEHFPGYPWYYWFTGHYEYSLAYFINNKQFTSNKILINIASNPDSLEKAFSDLKENIENFSLIDLKECKNEKYETLAEKYKGTFYEQEFYYKLLKSNNYYDAINNQGDAATKLRERAISLYKYFITKYPNSEGSYNLFKHIYYGYSENISLIEDIIDLLKTSSPNCWLLEVLNNQPDYMFKEIKHLLK